MINKKWGYSINKEYQCPNLQSAIQQILSDLKIPYGLNTNYQMLLDILKNQIQQPIRIVFKLDESSTPKVSLFKPQVFKSSKLFILINTYLVESCKMGIQLIESKSYYQCDEQLYYTYNSQTSLDETGKGLDKTINNMEQKCLICEEYYKKAIQLPCCAYQNHQECFQQYLNISDCYTFEGYICQNQQCKQPISLVYLEKYMDPKKYQYIQAHYKPGYMRCPECEKYCYIGNQRKVECDQCHYEIQFGLSSKDKLMINDLQNNGTLFIICPFCNQVTTKDDGCNHVTCVCKKELCALCSVDRIPILAHGAHYHRKGCKHHSEFHEEYDPQNCMICRVNQQKCSYPQSLEDYMESKRKI